MEFNTNQLNNKGHALPPDHQICNREEVNGPDSNDDLRPVHKAWVLRLAGSKRTQWDLFVMALAM